MWGEGTNFQQTSINSFEITDWILTILSENKRFCLDCTGYHRLWKSGRPLSGKGPSCANLIMLRLGLATNAGDVTNTGRHLVLTRQQRLEQLTATPTTATMVRHRRWPFYPSELL